MSKLFFIFILALPSLSQGQNEFMGPPEPSICFEAYDECASQCSSTAFSSLKYRFHTNVKRKCKQACEAGKNSCDLAAKWDECSEFKLNCQDNCSFNIFDRRNNKYIFVSTARRQCKETCTKAALFCELN